MTDTSTQTTTNTTNLQESPNKSLDIAHQNHKIQKKQTEKIAKTMKGNFLRKGYEELIKTMGPSKKSSKKRDLAENQISKNLEKYEENLKNKRIFHP